jgi:versiconal hemiacetal acetate esterase
MYEQAHKNASVFGGDANKFFSIGASAGGGLALTVCDQLIKSGEKSSIQGVVAMVPVAAHPDSVPSAYKSQYTAYKDNKSGVPVIDKSTMDTFFQAAAVDTQDEKVFVTLSKGLKEFPKTYIATCGKDPLRDDGVILNEMLKKEGVETKYDHYEGVPHYFWLMPGADRGVEFLDNVVKGAKFVLGQ